jgi:hypothetical protein
VTHEYQGSVEVLVVLLDVVHVIFYCLPLVDGVEVSAGIIGLDGLEERSESVLEAIPVQPATEATYGLTRTTLDQFVAVGSPFRPFLP